LKSIEFLSFIHPNFIQNIHCLSSRMYSFLLSLQWCFF